jgi:DNA modification methylase
LYLSKTIKLSKTSTLQEILNKTIHQDLFEAIKYIPNESIDLAD